MVSLLDLAGEISNQIWNLCLVSPTGTAQPLSRRDAYYSGIPVSCSSSGPFFYLLVDNTDPIMGQHEPFLSRDNPWPAISLSLPRTCRQVYNETNELFWTSNSFFFASPHRLLQTFKGMGRYAPRQITSIRLRITPLLGNDLEWLNKVLQLLIKQGEHCSVRRLELMIDEDSVKYISGSKPHPMYSNHINRPDYWHKTVLPCLKQARRLQNTKKALVIIHALGFATAEAFHNHTLTENLVWPLWDMHKSWGGWLYWGTTMIYEETSSNTPFDDTPGFEIVEMGSLGQGGWE